MKSCILVTARRAASESPSVISGVTPILNEVIVAVMLVMAVLIEAVSEDVLKALV